MDLVDEQTSFGSRLVRSPPGRPDVPVPARRSAAGYAHLERDDVCKRRFAESWRAEDQHVIQRLAAVPRRVMKISICCLTIGCPT